MVSWAGNPAPSCFDYDGAKSGHPRLSPLATSPSTAKMLLVAPCGAPKDPPGCGTCRQPRGPCRRRKPSLRTSRPRMPRDAARVRFDKDRRAALSLGRFPKPRPEGHPLLDAQGLVLNVRSYSPARIPRASTGRRIGVGWAGPLRLTALSESSKRSTGHPVRLQPPFGRRRPAAGALRRSGRAGE